MFTCPNLTQHPALQTEDRDWHGEAQQAKRYRSQLLPEFSFIPRNLIKNNNMWAHTTSLQILEVQCHSSILDKKKHKNHHHLPSDTRSDSKCMLSQGRKQSPTGFTASSRAAPAPSGARASAAHTPGHFLKTRRKRMSPACCAADSASGYFPAHKGEGKRSRDFYRQLEQRRPGVPSPPGECVRGDPRALDRPLRVTPGAARKEGRGPAGRLPEPPRLASASPPRSRRAALSAGTAEAPFGPDVRPGGQEGLEGRTVHPPVRWREGEECARLQLPTTSLSFSHHTQRRRHSLRGYSGHTKRDGRRLLRRVLRDKWLLRTKALPGRRSGARLRRL